MDVGVNKPLKKCCISNCMDGMEDDAIYEEDEATVSGTSDSEIEDSD